MEKQKLINRAILNDLGILSLKLQMTEVLNNAIPKYIDRGDGEVVTVYDENVDNILDAIKRDIKIRQESIVNFYGR